jgi:hypothetical protein
MHLCFWRRILVSIAVFCVISSVWAIDSPSALAYENPDLLPSFVTPVVDLAKTLPDPQQEKLVKELEQFETDTGWKLRVLTQYDRTPGRAVIKYWGLDDKSILLVADARGGNILSFSVGDAVYEFLPRTFWIELQTRFGNLYFVREQGEDQAILQALDSVKGCLIKGGCNVVPGLPKEQWILTLVTSAVLAMGVNFFTLMGDVVYCLRYCSSYYPYKRLVAPRSQYFCLCYWCSSSLFIPHV